MTPNCACDLHLVMTGPQSTETRTTGATRPWTITSVYLFDTQQLLADQRVRGVQVGVASSVRDAQWQAAEIYPNANTTLLILNDEQRRLLALFAQIDT